MRQIDADKLEREITLAYIETCRGLTLEQIDAVARFSAKVISMLGHTPTADAEPIKHGRWIKSKKSDYNWECSNCGYGLSDYRTTYCYDCGARMDEQQGVE